MGIVCGIHSLSTRAEGYRRCLCQPCSGPGLRRSPCWSEVLRTSGK
ncbi:hypothetical protein IEO21_04948 [Rhodonia placenta]|uniref:Uncharacterized protein n=1 Tax=Rhodonia placenta TaxID=104341 RepID=A0A8H7P361_9APHY|nr:hypothetical protein IEO21_04948 [Postia placenta]